MSEMQNIINTLSELSNAKISSSIVKDECIFSCATPYCENGLYLCLHTLKSVSKEYLNLFSESFGSKYFLNYKYQRILQKKENSKATKIAINVEGGFSSDNVKIKHQWSIVTLPVMNCFQLPEFDSNPSVNISNLMSALSVDEETAGKINKIQTVESSLTSTDSSVWEDKSELSVSKYAENLFQMDNGIKIPPKGWKCSKCDLTQNLWLNLSDGHIFCGRKFWDGSGGNNHAVEHYELTKYPLAVKLGTITPNTAEVYSYPEDKMVIDPKISQHLAHWGINQVSMEKTDKTLVEMEINANERFGDWLLLQETNSLTNEPRYGPGLTGIHNLGNSCYMNSVLHCLFSIEPFRQKFAYKYQEHLQTIFLTAGCNLDENVVQNFCLQFSKIGHALCSGDYSYPSISEEEMKNLEVIPNFAGIRPQLFRSLVGKGHPEFSTKRLQDSHEYFHHLMSFLEKEPNSKTLSMTDDGQQVELGNPLESILISIQDRLECGSTKKVKYSNSRDFSLNLRIDLNSLINSEEMTAFEALKKELEGKNEKLKPEQLVRPKIRFSDCLRNFLLEERIDDWLSPATKEKTFAMKSIKLNNFPDYLWCTASRFTLDTDWTPKKLDVELLLTDKSTGSETVKEVNDFVLDLSFMRSKGGDLQPGEESLPDESCVEDEMDQNTLNSVMEMGFTLEAAKKGIKFTKNSGVEAAMTWIMEHIDDADLNDPTPAGNKTKDQEPNESDLQMMMCMGVERNVALVALKRYPNQLDVATDWALNNPDAIIEPDQPATSGTDINSLTLSDGPATYKLIAMISHIGKSTSHGHYVSHIKRSALSSGIPVSLTEKKQRLDDFDPNEWIIFNDEKVQHSEQPPFGHAYMYLWKRFN